MSMFSRETPARSGQSGSTDRGDKSSQRTPRVTSRDAVALLVLLGLNWFVVLWLFSGSASRVTIPYRPTFLAQLQEGNVDSITAQESAIDGTLKKAIRYPRSDKNAKATTRFSTRVPDFADTRALDLLLQKNGVVVKAKAPAGTPWWESLFAAVLPAGLLFAFYYWAMRKQTGTGSMFSFGKAKAKQYEPTTESVTFADVAGIDDAKGSSPRS
jgi:cell division protease FtsH